MVRNTPRPSKERVRRDASARLLRKRETDRLAQRANRERTKRKIELLEEEIRRLKSRDQNAVLVGLMEANENQRKRNDELEATLFKISLAIKSVCGSRLPSSHDQNVELLTRFPESSSDDANIQSGSEYDTSTSSGHEAGLSSQDVAVTDPSNIRPSVTTTRSQADTYVYLNALVEKVVGDKQTSQPNSTNDIPTEIIFPPDLKSTSAQALSLATDFPADCFSGNFNMYSQNLPAGQHLISPGPYGGLTFHTLAMDEEKWDISNDAFTRALQSAALIPGPDEVDPDVPFKAILSGWHTVDPYEREKPIWNMLRLIDERVFGLWTSKIQKVALMYITHMLVKYRMRATPENLQHVPTWLRSRPSQEQMPHPLVIDLLLWPGLRDRLVFDHPKYTKTGEFSSFYCNHLHFYWPFSADSIGTFNPYTNRFQVSLKFKEYVLDLRNWTMDSHFLTRYPELKDDITAYEDRTAYPI